jgi:RNA-directed DNA polymerase
MGSIQRETRPSMQREDQLTMETKLEQIAAKARCEPKLRFTSLAHHITRDRVRKNLSQIPKWSAAGVDGQTVEAARKSFDGWIEPMLQSVHRQGYGAPDIRRVYIPKPGKTEKCCLPFMSRTFCPAHSVAGQSSALIMPWRPSMRSSPAA